MPLSEHDYIKLKGVNPALIRVLEATKSPIEFRITQGSRTAEEEMALWLTCHNPDESSNGKKWLTSCNGYALGDIAPNGIQGTGVSHHQGGFAIDFAAFPDGVLSWQEEYYSQIAGAILEAAAKLDTPVVWGGSWLKKDTPHIELNRNFYKGV